MDFRAWHEWCTAVEPAEPPPLTVKQWRELDDVQRGSRIKQLSAWLNQYHLPTAGFVRVADNLNKIVDRNTQTSPGAKTIPVLTGENTVGKSTFAMHWARGRYLLAIQSAPLGASGRPVWYPTPDVEVDLSPVVYISLGDNSRPKGLDGQLLDVFGLPEDNTVPGTTLKAMRAVARHRVKIVVIDDVHLLKLNAQRTAREVLDHIKHINTLLGDNGASLVLVGANLTGGELLSDPQIKGRSKTQIVKAYDFTDDEDEQREWQRVVRDYENLILPHLPAGKPGMLSQDLLKALWLRSQGYFQDFSELICSAAIAAASDGTYKILRRHLEAIRLSDRAEEEFSNMTAREFSVAGVEPAAAFAERVATKATAGRAKAATAKRKTTRRVPRKLRLIEDDRP